MDIKAHIEGQSVNWEQWQIPIKLANLKIFAPISDTEIAFLKADDDVDVKIYNVETR